MAVAEAHIDIWPGALIEVLSISKGDLKITVGPGRADRERAKKLISDMLRAGYAIFVETDKGPVRVQGFEPDHMAYLVLEKEEAGADEQAAQAPEEAPAPNPRRTRKARSARREIPVAGSKATAVGRTAGG